MIPLPAVEIKKDEKIKADILNRLARATRNNDWYPRKNPFLPRPTLASGYRGE